MLTHAKEHIRDLVVGKDGGEADLPRKDNVIHHKSGGVRLERRIVSLHTAERADYNKSGLGINVLFIVRKGADNVLLLLVRRNSANEDDIYVSVIRIFLNDLGIGSLGVILKGNENGANEHIALVSHSAKLRRVVLRNGHSVLYLFSKKLGALIAVLRKLGSPRAVGTEEIGRSDIVIYHHLATRHLGKRIAELGSGAVIEDDHVFFADILKLPYLVDELVLHAVIHVFRIDSGLIAHLIDDPCDSSGIVTYRISKGHGGHYLNDLHSRNLFLCYF